MILHMRSSARRRVFIIILCVLALFVTNWLELFLQRKQNVIGAGINRVFLFLLINLHVIAIVILLFLIIRQSLKLFSERRKELPGSVFKRNLLFAFTFFSVIPSFFVFFTAGKFITTSIDDWFHVRISTGLKSAFKLHEAQTSQLRTMLHELGKRVAACPAADCIKAFEQLKKNYTLLDQCSLFVAHDQSTFVEQLTHHEIKVWRRYRRFNDRSMQSLKYHFLDHLKHGFQEEQYMFDFYGSLYWVKQVNGSFIVLVQRYPEQIRGPLIEIQNSSYDYAQLKSMRNPIYRMYMFTFILVTLLILFLSIWCAFYLARGLSAPIQELLEATEKIRKGKFDTQVTYEPSSDLKALAIGFNEMTEALKQAHVELERKNKEMLVILENIKASVFFINQHARVVTFNRAAQELVDYYLGLSRFKNKKVSFFGHQVKEKFFKLARELAHADKQYLSQEISFSFKSEVRILMIHMTALSVPNSLQRFDRGVLLVIEDLTDIVKMSKLKTWQEAAKQMAHEIKNPLTPIQLATQRLQRKYGAMLHQDSIFIDCTDTILNHVKIIKDLASHFSAFASMPSPIIEPVNINEVIQEVMRSYQVSYPDFTFSSVLQSAIEVIKTDKKKIKQVLINLLDNSVRALFEHKQHSSKKQITIKTALVGKQMLEILVSDTGPGIAKSVRDTLFLPYVSSSKKNMGLGLAIVHDIITQLGGSIKLIHVQEGALFQILLPL